MKKLATYLGILLTLGGVGCAVQTEPSPDGIDDVGLTAGKADGSDYNDCELEAVVNLVNDPGTSTESLKEAGVHTRASRNLIEKRNGPDGAPGTDDDFYYEDIEQVDDVSWVGPVAMRQLVAAIADSCVDPGLAGADVIFSPVVDWEDSHVARISQLLDSAERSADIAMYSFSDPGVTEAVLRNADRIAIRVLYDKGHLGRGLENSLEEAGITVRHVGQTMHHKYVLIDGVHAEGDDPASGTVVSGTANWSTGAVDTYDESTVFISGNAEMNLRFQREFNFLWNNSRETETGYEDRTEYFETMEITDEMIAAVDDPGMDAMFTSDNFRVISSGLRVDKETYKVGNRWVEAIENAEESIWLFQERLRMVPVADALIRKAQENPDIEIRVFMDNQEYRTWWSGQEMLEELEDCRREASTETQLINCEAGMYYSPIIAEAFEASDNHEARLSYYAYNWHYSFPQMHNKTMIIDGRTVYTGSYNLSFNAEFNTFENVMVIDGAHYPAVVDEFIQAMDQIWSRNSDGYDALMDEVQGDSTRVPIRFDPMSMTWHQVDAYREAARDACGGGQLYDLGRNDERAWTCTRE